MVTITASAGTGGTIDPTGEVTVVSGEDQTFTFTAGAGYEIDKVLVDGVEVTISGNTYTMTNVTEDGTIAVSFKETIVSHTITATAGTGGTISPSGAVVVNAGGDQLFTFTAGTGYEIDKVLVDGAEVVVVGNTYTIENVSANGTIAVSFKADEPEPVEPKVKVIHDVFGASRVDVLHFSGEYPTGGVPVGIKDGIVFFNKNLWGYTHLGLIVIIGNAGELEGGTDLEGLSALVIYR